MQNAGVESARDDWVVSEAARAALYELMDELGLYIPLADTRLDESQHAAESRLGDVARGLGKIDFFLGFNRAQPVDQRGEAAVVVQREKLLAFLGEAQRLRDIGKITARVLVDGKVNAIRLCHQTGEDDVEIRSPLDPADARAFPGLFLCELRSLPYRNVVVGFAKEKNFAVFRLPRVREQDQHRFLLRDARKIKQIVVLLKGVEGIRVRNLQIVGLDDRHRTLREEGGEVFSVVRE
jgi:hypothetical protein